MRLIIPGVSMTIILGVYEINIPKDSTQFAVDYANTSNK